MAFFKKQFGHPVPFANDPSLYNIHTWEKSEFYRRNTVRAY